MIEITYSPEDEVNIEGDEKSLIELCTALRNCSNSGIVEIQTKPDLDPSPYEHLLNKLIIKLNNNINKLSVLDDALIIEGNKEFLLNFEANIPWDAEDTTSGINYHVHYDNVSFGEYLSDDSLDAVLSKKRKNA